MSIAQALLPWVTLQAPEVPDSVLEQALALASRDFFKESEAWTPRLERFMTFSGVNEFDIPLPPHTRIARTHWVRLNQSQELPALRYEQIGADEGQGYFITDDSHTILVTSHTPRGWMEVHAAIYPTSTSAELPAHLLEDFGTALTNLTLSRIYGLVGSAWFDRDQSLLLAASVQQEIVRARRLSDNRRSAGRKTVRYGGL